MMPEGEWLLEVGLFRKNMIVGRKLGTRLRDIRRCRLPVVGEDAEAEALAMVDDFVWIVDPYCCWRKYWRLYWLSGSGRARMVAEERFNTQYW